MTRTIGLALQAHYEGAVTTIALCINLTLARWQPRITDITKANPGVVGTRWAHGYATGDTVKIVGVEGMTEVNDNFYPVTVVDSTHFSIGVDTSAFGTYAKGSWYGTARKTLGFTSHTADIVFNGVLYRSSNGADGSAISTTSDLALSSRDVTVLIDSTAITVEDLERGVYSGAEYETFEVNYQDLTQGRVLLEVGRLGDINVKDQVFVAEGLSLVNLLHQNTGPTISPVCRAQLGNRISDTYDERYGCKVRLNPPTWLASTAYTAVQSYDAALGSIVKPSTYNGRHFKCTTAGTSGGSEPSWNTALGATTNDNTAVWTAIEAKTKTGSITRVIDTRTFGDTSRSDSLSGWYNHGLLTFLTGANTGWASEVKRFYFDAAGAFQEYDSGFASSTSIVLDYPVIGLLANDVFIMHIAVSSDTVTASTPSGWTLLSGPQAVQTGLRYYIFAKISSGSESASQTVTFSSSVSSRGTIFRLRGFTLTLIDSDLVTGSDTTIEAPALTAAAGAPVLALALVTTPGVKTFSSWTGETGGDWVDPILVAARVQLQTALLPSGGALSGGAQTVSGSTDWVAEGFMFGLAEGVFELRDKPPAAMAASDTYEVEAGCDKILDTCKTKFDNVYNFRGEPWLPGFNKSLIYPDSR